MSVPFGEVPIRHFERRLRRFALLMVLGYMSLAAGSQIVIGGRLGTGVGMFLSLVFILVAMTWSAIKVPRCPACGTEARHTPEAHKRSRIRYPYGWASRCHACGIALDEPWRHDATSPPNDAPGDQSLPLMTKNTPPLHNPNPRSSCVTASSTRS